MSCLNKIKRATKTQLELRRVVRKLNYFKQKMYIQNRIENNTARKAETRQKIMMGGLIVKAGLTELHAISPEVILGILLDAKVRLQDKDYYKFCQHLGYKNMRS